MVNVMLEMLYFHLFFLISAENRKSRSGKVRLPFVHCQQLVLHTGFQIRRLEQHINPFIYDRMFLDLHLNASIVG